MKLSARNTWKGTVKSIEHGAVNSEVVVELPGGMEVVSVVTKHSADRLGLAPGASVWVVVKASNVLLATD